MNTKYKILDEIEKLKNRLKELEAELGKYKDLTPQQILAEEIHASFCRHNHTDGCGWGYETWESPGYAKKEYLEIAGKLLDKHDMTTIMSIVQMLTKANLG